MCRLTEGYYNDIREPGRYGVYRRFSGSYMYLKNETVNALYVVNVRQKGYPSFINQTIYGDSPQQMAVRFSQYPRPRIGKYER